MRRIEKLIGLLLLVGVAVSALTVLLGGVLFLVRHGSEQVHYRVFHGEPSDLKSIVGVCEDLEHGSGRGVIQLGLILLVAVQFARVALTGVLFMLSRDKIFAFLSNICGLIPARGGGQECDRARFPWLQRYEIRKNVWSSLGLYC